MATKSKNKDVLYIRNLDPAIRRAYRAACVRRGISMTQEIRDHILNVVREHEPEAIKRMRQKERLPV